MDHIPELVLDSIRETLVGKRIILRGHKTIGPFPDSDIIGNCDAIGYNSRFPSFGLQVTIDRMPCFNIDLSQISLETQK